MFCGSETVDVPEAKPRETATVEGPQNILISRGLSQQVFYSIPRVKETKK